MNPNYYLAMDTEHGGFAEDDSPLSLLEAYFGIYSDNWQLVDELTLLTKPDNGVYQVQAEALEVNKINIVEHDKVAVRYKDAKTPLYKFLSKYSDNGKYKLIPVGHHVHGDIKLIIRDLSSRGGWSHNVSYRMLDTGVMGQYLRARGVIPHDVKGSLGSLCDFFGVPLIDAHTAKADGDASAMLMKVLLQLKF